MNKKAYLKVIFLFLMIFGVACPVFAWGKKDSAPKEKEGLYDVVLDRLGAKHELYAGQIKQINKKITELEKQQVRQGKKQNLENQLSVLVVNLAGLQSKLADAEHVIKEYQDKKDQIELAVEVESIIGSDTQFQVNHKLPAEISKDSGKNPTGSAPTEYVISGHDEVQINVYGEPDLTKTVRVAADGTISYPLLGRVNVDGLTAQQLEEKLGKLLSEGGYIVNPQVSVYVEKFSSISILGEVRNPGSYELKGKLGIMDAVAQAGGFNIDADINNVKILRTEDGQQKTIHLKLGDLKKGLEGAEIILKPDDTVFIEKIGKVTVLGEVARPGTFELKDKISVLEAIAMAGGFTNIAAINRTRIIREDPDSKKRIIRIHVTDITNAGRKDKDLELLPGDIVYVPETLF